MAETAKLGELIEPEYGESPNNVRVQRFAARPRVVEVTLVYPMIAESSVTHVEVNQESLRASDGVRLHYDYDRDGWSIEQPFHVERGDEVVEEWVEVAFLKSWALDKDDDDVSH